MVTVGPGCSQPVGNQSRDNIAAPADRRIEVVLVGLFAALPVVIATARALANGWSPVFDEAIIATRSLDVFTSHSPLVGVASDASVRHIGTVFAPGPMLFWLLAIPVRVGGWTLPLTIGTLNTAAVVGIVALARRRGGRGLTFGVGAVLLCLLGGLPQSMLAEPDNSRAPFVAFVLLIFLAWSVAAGEYQMIAMTVLVASFVVQTHFALVIPAITLIVIASIGTARTVRVDRPPRRWWLSGALAFVVCWSPTVIDQMVHRPGNLTLIERTAVAGEPTAGASAGWDALVRAVGIPPKWLGSYVPLGETREVLSHPSVSSQVSCALLLAALVGVALIAVRRGRTGVAIGAFIALALDASIVPFAASLSFKLLFKDYAFRWTGPVGMFSWLMLGWAVGLVASRRWVQIRSRAQPVAVVLGVVAAALLMLRLARAPRTDSDSLTWAFRPSTALSSALARRLDHRTRYLVTSSISAYAFQTACVYGLRSHGFSVAAPARRGFNLAVRLGKRYDPDQSDVRLVVGLSFEQVPRGARVIVQEPVHGAPPDLGLDNQPAPTSVWVAEQ